MFRRLVVIAAACSAGILAPANAGPQPGEAPALGSDRITQEDVTSGDMSLTEIRLEGLRIFTTLFNKLDGYGDGPMNIVNPVEPGGRPTLQGNGTLLRVNGLDARGCIECHAMVSAATVPPRLGIGGVGGSNANAIILPTNIDMSNPDFDGSVIFNGRFANPPFVFGAGAIELLAAEMTEDLQALKARAQENPGSGRRRTPEGRLPSRARAYPSEPSWLTDRAWTLRKSRASTRIWSCDLLAAMVMRSVAETSTSAP